jgi:hypothetical protein
MNRLPVPPTFFIAANQDTNQPSAAKLVGATGNLFMGIQLQCAECHRHPFTAKWDMSDFWGMAAFYGHTRFDRPPGKKKFAPATVVEVDRLPVLNKKGKIAKGPKAKKGIDIGLAIPIPDPTDPRRTLRIARGRYFESDRPLPAEKVPYRPHLAAWLTSADNRYFSPATVNRWWAHFFARGLVNPIEDMSPENKASHPALLDMLSDEFTSSGHDLRYLIRAICNSKAYQRTSRPLRGNQSDEKLLSRMPVKVMTPYQLLDSLAVVTNTRTLVAPQMKFKGMKGAKFAKKSVTGIGGHPLVRFFDTREYDDDPTELTYGVPQLLRLMNSNLTGSSDAVAVRLARLGDRPRVIEEMYLLALARRPSPLEVERISSFVGRHSDPVKGYAGALWALLNSAEFISVR